MGRAHLHAQTQHRTEEPWSGPEGTGPQAFTIALSREAGVGGGNIAREVGARLDWPVYDRELLKHIAEKMGHDPRILEGVDEKHVSWIRESIDALMAVPAVHSSAYVRRLVQTLLSLAAQGACVIVGRGAPQVLPPATTLRVRLVGPRESRIAALGQRLSLSREEAELRVDTTDRERHVFVKDHFHLDPADPHNYDLVLNAPRLGATECADLIVDALRRLQARAKATRQAK
jgi:cytidylate kinase